MFVNVCSHPLVDPVCGANLVPVSEEHMDTWGLGNARVPVLVGPTRNMRDSDGHDATAVDVLFHPSVVRRALTGGKSVTKEHFRDYLMDIAEKNVAEDHGIAFVPGRNAVMEVARYKGPKGENKDNTHAFPVFADVDRDEKEAKTNEKTPATRAALSNATRSATTTEVSDERLVEASDASSAESLGKMRDIRKPIKKGFLRASSGRGVELYPEGSAEGIPKPGEQYDPLGHIPENVRKKCHVIDSGALRGEDFERVARQYAETGRLDTSVPGVYAKGSEPGGKREVGIGHPKVRARSARSASRSEPALQVDGEPLEKPFAKLVPEHATTVTDSSVEIVLKLPSLRGGMASVEINTSETSVLVVSPEYAVSVTLPKRVDPDATTAKFSSKRKTLTILMPAAPRGVTCMK